MVAAFQPTPFHHRGEWIRAGFHCHTVNSDGGLSPEETLDRYRRAGYRCVGVTDHRLVTDVEQFSTRSFLVLNSTEVGIQPDIIGVGVRAAVPRGLAMCQAACDLAKQGAFVIGAHPTYSSVMPETYLACPSLMGMEIYNAYCEEAYANGLATELWDMLLGAGKRIWGVAADDAHLNPKKGYFSDIGKGWMEIWAEELTRNSVLNALMRGSFYSTQGPRFEWLKVEGPTIEFRCAPVKRIRWRTRGSRGHVEYALEEKGLTESRLPDWFVPRGYVRIELVDAAGLTAWSNPFFVESYS